MRYVYMIRFVASLLALLLFAHAGAISAFVQEDPFKPFLTGREPSVVKELGEEIFGQVKVRKLVFHSRSVSTDSGTVATKIFAAVCRPVQPGKYPGLLVLHGGGGAAEVEKARKWAALGYIVVTLDIPGVCNPEKVPLSEGLWKSYAYGKNRFTAKPDIRSSTIFDGALASVQALYLLLAQPDVIKNRVGITGISWGGYMTTMVSGLAGTKVHASFSVYGSGFYDAGSVFLKELDQMPAADRSMWLKYLDAGRRISEHKSPFFIAAATNDNWFYPPAVTKTLLAMKGDAGHLFAANANHKIPDLGGTTRPEKDQPGWLAMEQLFFDFYLKNIGSPMPVIMQPDKSKKTANESLRELSFEARSTTKIVSARVYFSEANKEWNKRDWKEITAMKKSQSEYQTTLPDTLVGKEIDWYPSVSDDRPVTVSGYMQRLKL